LLHLSQLCKHYGSLTWIYENMSGKCVLMIREPLQGKYSMGDDKEDITRR
jgi:hypothetical protein